MQQSCAHQKDKVCFKHKKGRALEARNYKLSNPQPAQNKKRRGWRFSGKQIYIRQDNTEDGNLRWSRTVEDLITVMLLKFLNSKYFADSQINA
ncbi:hypothetical protein TNIN_342631 [Trichonephila inaurata madagascariensis]|uniref:Uncharacterized protein n=1 Tax=Trichonephila inaurata madagascariensis TaxID=2747483 RepID=A0A8X7CM57_9ARAC|nr:hypothetical protein TNIN_342631 [Trichonephila inaurata madagascariensis]